jgi:hypothetical protein
MLWMYSEAKRTGFRPNEAAIGILAFMLPMAPLEIALHGRVLIAPLVIIALFVLVTRRALGWVGVEQNGLVLARA